MKKPDLSANECVSRRQKKYLASFMGFMVALYLIVVEKYFVGAMVVGTSALALLVLRDTRCG